MSIAPISTDLVELDRVYGTVFALRVGHNIIHLDTPAIADLIALLHLPQYADGDAGQTAHVDREHQENPDSPAAFLIAHIGAYDAADKPSAAVVASEPYRAPAPGRKPTPNLLTLALAANGATYVAVLSRTDAVRLIVTATHGMSDAS